MHPLCVLLHPGAEERGQEADKALRSTEEQRHKPFWFGSPGERWQCLAPAVSSGVLWFKQSCCSLEKPYTGVIWGSYKCFREVCVGPRHGCSLQRTERERWGSGTEQGFPNACQPTETAMPSGRSVFSSPQSLSKRVGGLSWEEIRRLPVSLVLKTNACSHKGHAGGLVLTLWWKSCTVHGQQEDQEALSSSLGLILRQYKKRRN